MRFFYGWCHVIDVKFFSSYSSFLWLFPGVDHWQVAIPYVPKTSQVIGDLTPGSCYQFRVSANNVVGISEASLPSDIVTIPTEYGKPLNFRIY